MTYQEAMIEYQKAVAQHMCSAPKELREYVCERLTQSVVWKEGRKPILCCGFLWDKSEEGLEFWDSVDTKEWQKVMATDFWQSYTQQPKPEAMNDYKEAVADHMATAPEELREYVCERLTNDSWWTDYNDPIDECGFLWEDSEEGRDFWVAINTKEWLEAMDSKFWQSHTQQPKPEAMNDYQQSITDQLLAVAEYVYNHFDDSSSKTAKDYLQDFLNQ